jgi:hypothetical protein
VREKLYIQADTCMHKHIHTIKVKITHRHSSRHIFILTHRYSSIHSPVVTKHTNIPEEKENDKEDRARLYPLRYREVPQAPTLSNSLFVLSFNPLATGANAAHELDYFFSSASVNDLTLFRSRFTLIINNYDLSCTSPTLAALATDSLSLMTHLPPRGHFNRTGHGRYFNVSSNTITIK